MVEGPDKGRSWLIAAAVLVTNMITSGIFRSQGLLFVEFINNYKVDRQVAALPFSVRTAVRNLAAPVIGILGQKYGIPTVTVIGGILGSFSSALCYFASDMIWMTIIWGGLNGFTLAMINVLPQIVISQYFVKHRSTATGLSFSGCPISAIVFPVILEILLKSYGLQGTFLILAGFFMHTIPAGMLLKKPPWYKEADDQKLEKCEHSNSIKEDEITSARKFRKASTAQKKRDFGIQVGNDKFYDFCNETRTVRNVECKHPPQFKRSLSHGSLVTQAHLNNLQLTTMFPRVSSIELNCRTFNKNPKNIYDVDIEYLKRQSDLVFQMLTMEIPNVEISYRAILLEVEQDDLWHPEQNEIMQEIECIYCHIEKSMEMDEISIKSGRPSGPYLRRTLLNGALDLNEKSDSLRVVKRYLKTYKERGLQQLGKIRSAPNMSNIYNEIARKDYVLTKLKELCNGNEIRIISQLCQYNPKDVLRILFQLRTLYNLYNDLECCDKCEGEEFGETVVETGDISLHRKESFQQIDVDEEEENVKNNETVVVNTFKVHIITALKLHTKLIFLLICCTRVTFFLCQIPMYTTLVDFGMDKGLEVEDGKYIIGALSLGDLVGRLCFGWITDKEYASFSQYMSVGMIVQGAALISVPLMYTKWAILISIALFGLIQGSLYVRHPVLIAKYLRPQEQSIAIGCMEFFAGILLLFLPLYIGYFRDNMGSYDPMYYINGALVILIGFVWSFERCLVNEQNETAKK